MIEKNIKWVALALLCTTIVSSGVAFYYLNQYNTIKANYDETLADLVEFTILVNIMFDYGNGTIEWYNETRLAVGTDLMTATGYLVEIEYTESEWGAFIDKINGVGKDPGTWWLWTYYEEGWQMGPVGADQWILHNGDILSWTYSKGT
jgi:hypothetical protein